MNSSAESAVREYLSVNKWPTGLQEEYLRGLSGTAKVFVLVDDSGSMNTSDSRKFIKHGAKFAPVTCSRWAELHESIQFLAGLAHSSKHPTTFRLLNNASPITIGGPKDDGSAYGQLTEAMQLPPNGGTPLCAHMNAIVAEIAAMNAELRASNKKVKVIIATDGEPSDGDLSEALRQLKTLPVWLVLRLCTDDERVVSYWKNVDTDLELNMEVLDDLSQESSIVAELNPWLLYSEPLHRLRETGCMVRELDFLNEVKLTADQVRTVCILIFGAKYRDLPHPEVDWKGFVTAVTSADNDSEHSWAPVAKAVSYHIDRKALAKHLGKPECAIM